MTVDVVETRDAPATPLVPAPAVVEKREAKPASTPPVVETPRREAEPVVDPVKDPRIRGRAILDGPLPRRKRIMTNIPDLVLYDESQTVNVESRGIRNVFVYLKKVEGRFEVPREPVELSFRGYQLGPRVVGARAGQDVGVTNLDRDTQNLHALPHKSKEMNLAMPTGQRDVLGFHITEVMVALKCDIHPWERAYIGVLHHPYFSVTDDDGAFELPAIAPGEYELGAWHEIYGTLEKRVVVADRTDSVEFVFVRR